MASHKLSRRSFLAASAMAFAGCSTTRRSRGPQILAPVRQRPVRLAAIGCGGMGAYDLAKLLEEGAELLALCDVDTVSAADSLAAHPEVPFYRDFREMLRNEPRIDAVSISTPDHTHAPAAVLAMSLGKHVYVQKPLAPTVAEAGMLLRAARRYKVATQMGNQGHGSDDTRALCEMIWDGAVGDIREVHCWTDRPIWPQGMGAPLPAEPVPLTLDWDLWLGSAPHRSYNHGYCPFNWRGWWDFGSGALGDMGCHILDAAFWALSLGAPESVECLEQEGNSAQTGPVRARLKFEFPARRFRRKRLPPVTLFWYEGGHLPPRPPRISEGMLLGDAAGKNGTLFIGEKGFLTCGTYGENGRLVPESANNAYRRPEPTIPRVGNSYRDWLNACRTGNGSCSNFEYSVPLTQMVLLGNAALRAGGLVRWDSQHGIVTNRSDVNQYLSRRFRNEWELDYATI